MFFLSFNETTNKKSDPFLLKKVAKYSANRFFFGEDSLFLKGLISLFWIFLTSWNTISQGILMEKVKKYDDFSNVFEENYHFWPKKPKKWQKLDVYLRPGGTHLIYRFSTQGYRRTTKEKFELKIHQQNRACKAKNNAQTTSEQLQNNFQKVKKTTFLTLKMVKSRIPILSILVKVSIFGCILVLKPQILPQKCSNRF